MLTASRDTFIAETVKLDEFIKKHWGGSSFEPAGEEISFLWENAVYCINV